MRVRMRIHEGMPSVRHKPSVYDVAERAGVSTATVSRVLAARRTGVLGLCFPDLDQDEGDAAYWYDEVIRGMERAARRSGYAVLIAASHHRDDSGLVLSIAGRCDGLVVLARTAPQAMIEHVATRVPVVLLAAGEGPAAGGGAADGGAADGGAADGRAPARGRPDRAIDNLAVANETGAYQVTSHLA